MYPEARTHLSPTDSPEGPYPRRRRSYRSQSRKSPSPTAELFPRDLSEHDDLDIPESKARRLMELRLMQNNLLNIVFGPSNSTRVGDEWLQLSRNMVPKMSLKHDNVLYASFALSATHLLRSDPDDDAVYSARQNYFVLALRQQREECARIDGQNAEPVCLASFLILRTSFAMMQERPLDVYAPPMEWLKMGRGAGAVMWKANAAVTPELSPSFKFFLDSYQHILAEQALDRDLDRPFSAVFETITEQRSSFEDQQAYRKTLAYINLMQKQIDSGEAIFPTGRMLQAFPMIIPGHFIDLVEARDLYALVVLAHFFGIAAQIDKDVWWLQGTGSRPERTAVREIKAIRTQLDESYQNMMLWPLMKARLESR